jgi:hypothetical protein
MSFKFSLSSGWEDHLEATYGPDTDSELFSDTPAIAWQPMGHRPVVNADPTMVTTDPTPLDPGEMSLAQGLAVDPYFERPCRG